MKKIIFSIIFAIFLACGNSVAFADTKTDSITVSQIDTISVAITKEVNIPDTVIEVKGKKYVLHFEMQEQSLETINKPEPWYRCTWAEYTMMVLLIVSLILAVYANLGNTSESEEDVKRYVDNKVEDAIKRLQKQPYSRQDVMNGAPKKNENENKHMPQTGQTTKKKEENNSKANVRKEPSLKGPVSNRVVKENVVFYAINGENEKTLTLVENDKYNTPIFIITLDHNDHTKGTYKVIDEDDVKKKFAQNSDQQKYCRCQGQGETITKQEPGEVTNIDEKNNSATITKKAIITLG